MHTSLGNQSTSPLSSPPHPWRLLEPQFLTGSEALLHSSRIRTGLERVPDKSQFVQQLPQMAMRYTAVTASFLLLHVVTLAAQETCVGSLLSFVADRDDNILLNMDGWTYKLNLFPSLGSQQSIGTAKGECTTLKTDDGNLSDSEHKCTETFTFTGRGNITLEGIYNVSGERYNPTAIAGTGEFAGITTWTPAAATWELSEAMDFQLYTICIIDNDTMTDEDASSAEPSPEMAVSSVDVHGRAWVPWCIAWVATAVVTTLSH